MRRSRCFILAGIAAAFGLFAAGCAAFRPVEDVSRYYLFDPDSYEPVAAEAEEVSVSVAIRRVEVVRYLDAPAVAVREANHRIRYSATQRWAEPLELGIARFLREALGREGFISTVKSDVATAYDPVDLRVTVRLLRCEGTIDREGARGTFRAEWEIRRGEDGLLLDSGAIAADRLPWDGRDYAMLVAGLNNAAIDLAREIAEAIRE